jgi:Phage integrase, N-terminal SAM-like domain
MASIEKRPRQDGRASWRAHYRTPSGEQRNKTFNRKAEAERFLASVESSKNTGSFVDSVLARITVGDWATHWLDNQTHLKPSTHERYAGIIREHIRPKWDRVKLANVSHADVQKWGNSAVEDPLTRDRPQDPPCALTDPQHGRQGRTPGPQRRDRRQSPAPGQGRAALLDPRTSRGPR